MDDLRAFYVERYREADRLFQSPHGVLERVRTQELLARHLPDPPARVLDVGGGTGVHAEWLVQRGYEALLVDLIEEHVAQATVPARVGDARSLLEEDASQDAVMVLGPLYHLLGRAERQAALAEAVRVARPGAPVFAAGICRYATLMDIGADGRLTAELEPMVRHLHATGEFEPSGLGFTATYFHTPEDLAGELRDRSARHRRLRHRRPGRTGARRAVDGRPARVSGCGGACGAARRDRSGPDRGEWASAGSGVRLTPRWSITRRRTGSRRQPAA